ncbi:glycoside hydrolase family 26 protein [Croceivirga thetidis]|uniref:Mannan endo-1,4-beta-mannosidase n=1 Tax=Croceivirga thetidis TaxID=2721623 RepID=A0ABX1GUG4_9FLAO|nr:glycosyl hydrolase [Croceivirga thetidis]NKI33303.1 beta-mannosidase [Croceivirga thetidis]
MNILFSSCKSSLITSSKTIGLSNSNASPETKHLQQRIKEIAKSGYAFGHQDATSYGIGWKNEGDVYRSDVNDVAGDFPGVYGFELGHLELGHEQNLDTVNFDLMSKLIKRAHEEGGLITISWHPNNPVSKKSAWNTKTAVPYILKDGNLHPLYNAWLSKIASFFKNLKTDDGKMIPVVFRPFHEMNGSWFWWGAGNCTPDEFKRLWIETHDILSKKFEVNNLIYCYSTDAIKNEKEYLKYYPGDNYVDVLGIDLYQKGSTNKYVELLNSNLKMLSAIAKSKNKPYAMTEGGYETLPEKDWWTQVFDRNLADKGIAWALVWRNAWPNHFYAPFMGQISGEDFVKFKQLPNVFFLSDVKKIK